MQNNLLQKRKLLHSPVAIVLLLLGFIYISYSTYDLYGKFREAREKRALAEETLREAQLREAQIKADLDKLSTERGVEEVIREKFNVVKEGEGVVVIPGATGESETPVQPTAVPKKGFLGRLWDKIFK